MADQVTAVDFPDEIFRLICDKLSQQDIYQCTLVCKSWNPHFQSELWKTILLFGKSDLYRIFGKNDPISHGLANNGQFIRRMEIDANTGVTRFDMRDFQLFAKNVEKLTAPGYGYPLRSLRRAINWRCWKTLLYLKVTCPGYDSTTDINVASLTERYTKYQETLNSFRWAIPSTAGWQLSYMESLHTNLPQLIRLSLDVPLTFSQYDPDLFKPLVPASSIKILHIFTRTDFSLWLHYISRKYPNLQELILERTTSLVAYVDSIERYFHYFGNPPNLQHLRKLKLVYEVNSVYDSRLIGSTLLDNPNIKELSLTLSYCMIFNVNRVHLLKENIGLISKGITELFVSCNLIFPVPDNDVLQFSAFSYLVVLHIDVAYTCIFIDELMNGCVHLEKLRLCATELAKDKPPKITPPKHKLCHIELERNTLHCDILSYISSRCYCLCTFYLIDSLVVGPVDRRTGFMYIAMWETTFNIFFVLRVRFRAVDTNWKPSSAVNLFCIYQSDKNESDDPRSSSAVSSPSSSSSQWYSFSPWSSSSSSSSHCDPENKEVQEKKKIENVAVLSDWFHIYRLGFGPTAGFDYQNLEGDDRQKAIDYFKGFESKDVEHDGRRNNLPHNSIDLAPSEYWQLDLPCGSAVFLCKGINSQTVVGGTFSR